MLELVNFALRLIVMTHSLLCKYCPLKVQQTLTILKCHYKVKKSSLCIQQDELLSFLSLYRHNILIMSHKTMGLERWTSFARSNKRSPTLGSMIDLNTICNNPLLPMKMFFALNPMDHLNFKIHHMVKRMSLHIQF